MKSGSSRGSEKKRQQFRPFSHFCSKRQKAKGYKKKPEVGRNLEEQLSRRHAIGRP